MAPKITFVIAARDPNYGGDLLHRFQVTLNGILYLATKYSLRCEILVIEWNPPSPDKTFRKLLTWGPLPDHIILRFIEVPPEIHQRFPNADRIPIHEYIAKNVGIRRSAGEYILGTNPDLLYTDELMSFLSSDTLSRNCFYRIDRSDVGKDIRLSWPVEEQLMFCSKNIVRVHGRDGIHAQPHRVYDFLLKCIKALRGPERHFRKRGPFGQIHTEASGDFFLLARQHWLSLKGYPELTTHMHIDSYICYMAASMGLKQVILEKPLRLYHQPHDRSSQAEFPRTDLNRLWEEGAEMLRTRKPLIINDESWGLGNDELDEYRFGS